MSVKRAAATRGDTKQRILQVATELMQARGYHGFTFQDVAARLGISHVAVHHHYKNKAVLVEATMRAYTADFLAALDEVAGATDDPEQQLRRYAGLFVRVAESGDRICMCGALAAELATLPAEARPAVLEFYRANEAWLAKVVARRLGRRSSAARVQQLAKAFLSLLEGAMIAARAFGDPSRVTSAASSWIECLPTT